MCCWWWSWNSRSTVSTWQTRSVREGVNESSSSQRVHLLRGWVSRIRFRPILMPAAHGKHRWRRPPLPLALPPPKSLPRTSTDRALLGTSVVLQIFAFFWWPFEPLLSILLFCLEMVLFAVVGVLVIAFLVVVAAACGFAAAGGGGGGVVRLSFRRRNRLKGTREHESQETWELESAQCLNRLPTVFFRKFLLHPGYQQSSLLHLFAQTLLGRLHIFHILKDKRSVDESIRVLR